ncbi:hypothetical protein METBIDRAFT_62923 [Metschnikowia bicuspidata var. bicuspidata NRRL YB-4993]|uniref:Anaphase-promoting complex subunit 5 n=1 Tax=Metschnikowia bicuspidata var. bicuspidata NRRL YB-4993 TaxID=869754 RepID=A0A1A0HGA6_9ASCO|nr:hypothetical protein METBIDRAFT_62923 [Metschnikowia bicuspidata var. bicuspidata NRRL YB-4993]OBA22912.1 hypothetical protein METBIDRAFT_62923 [Metschnikowia bicuspidata var. bicuspidata NRRL YB-4993]
MNEELSPQTITLALIIRLYLSNDLPESKFLLSFITQYLEGYPISEDKEYSANPTLLSLCCSIRRTYENYWRNNLTADTKRQRELSVDAFCLKILSILWSIDSADLLLLIVNDTYDFVSQRLTITYSGLRKVSQRSVIGRFAQKLAVSAKLLHFDESSSLFINFCLYRSTTLDHFKELKNTFDKSKEIHDANFLSSVAIYQLDDVSVSSDSHGNALSHESQDHVFYNTLNSKLDSLNYALTGDNGTRIQNFTPSYVESLVNTQIRLLQRYGSSTPAALWVVFSRMVSCENEIGKYNEFNNGELTSFYYLTYLENLHSGDYRGAFDSLHRYFDYMVSKGSRYFYHFALISKASLHQYFGENEKALDSIEEAISVARENKDNSTLTFILSWLFDFVRKNPSLQDTRTFSQIKNHLQLLDSLVQKSLSISLLLAAISYRYESEFYLNSGACFARYYESLFKSNYLSINDHVSSFIGGCHATSNLWELVGSPHLSSLYNDLGLLYSEEHGTSSDMQEFKFRKEKTGGRYHDKDIYNFDTVDVSAGRGLRHKLLFQSVEHSLLKGRHRLAYEILRSLPTDDDLDQDSRVEMLRLSAIIESAHGNHDEALTTLDSHLNGTSKQKFPMYSQKLCFLKLNMVKSQVLIQSGVPFKAFSLSLQLMEIAKLLGFLSISLQGCSLLVQILRVSGNTLDAYMLALSAIPLIFCLDNVSMSSTISYDLARLCFELLKHDGTPPRTARKDLFEQCLSSLSMSISGFKKIGDLQGLSRCFELEMDLQNASLLDDFSQHSQKALKILRKRKSEESRHSYVEGGLM